MVQSKKSSALETILNVGTGMILAFGVSQFASHHQEFIQHYIWSGFVWNLSPGSNGIMTVILTVVSMGRGYMWRRIFNHHLSRQLDKQVVTERHRLKVVHKNTKKK